MGHQDGASAFLGLSEEECGVLLVEGYDALARRLNTDAETHYMAVHLEWEDLENQLNELIRSLLLRRIYGFYMKRSDFYYWDIVLHKDGEISEKDSEYICERLDLRDISTDHFLYSDSIDQNQAACWKSCLAVRSCPAMRMTREFGFSISRSTPQAGAGLPSTSAALNSG